MKERWVGALLGLGVTGCAVDVDGTAGPEGDVAQVRQAIVDGKTVNKTGLVEVQIKDHKACTGVMINEKTVLTAAECVAKSYLFPNYSAPGRIAYFDPSLDDGDKRNVRTTESGGYGSVSVYIQSSYFDDEDPKALALVRTSSSWLDTDPTDYLRLSLGTCADIDTGTFYGRGGGGPGVPAGILRSTSIKFPYCDDDLLVPENGKTYCRGDKGGPAIVKAGFRDVVAAVHSFVLFDPDVECTVSLQNIFTRVNPGIEDWIEDIINDSCHHYESDGHEYIRCWD